MVEQLLIQTLVVPPSANHRSDRSRRLHQGLQHHFFPTPTYKTSMVNKVSMVMVRVISMDGNNRDLFKTKRNGNTQMFTSVRRLLRDLGNLKNGMKKYAEQSQTQRSADSSKPTIGWMQLWQLDPSKTFKTQETSMNWIIQSERSISRRWKAD